MFFLILDGLIFVAFILLFAASVLAGWKKVFGNRVVLALCLGLLLRYAALVYFHRDFIAGYVSFRKKDYALAEARMDRHLRGFPQGRLWRGIFHYEAGSGIIHEIRLRKGAD